MPPVIIIVVGAIGAVAVTRWVKREARRINAQLHPERYEAVDRSAEKPAGWLRRDASGIFRPD